MPPAKKKTTVSPKPKSVQAEPMTTSVTPTAQPKSVGMQQAVLGILIVVGLVGGYYAYSFIWTKPTPVATTNQNINTNVDTTSNENLNTNVPYVAGISVGTVKWTTPKTVTPIKLYTLPAGSDPMTVFDPNVSATMVEVGTVVDGEFKGGTVLRYGYTEDGPVQYPNYAYLIRLNGAYTMIMKNTDRLASYDGGPQLDLALVKQDDTHEFLELHYPDTLQGPKERQVLQRVAGVQADFSATGLTTAFTDDKYGPVYYNPTPATLKADALFKTYNAFYLKAPDNTVRVYKYLPDFIDAPKDPYTMSGVAHITWTKGPFGDPNYGGSESVNKDSYSYVGFGGCGATDYLNVVNVNLQQDMMEIGVTSFGDPIYTWKDTNAQRMKDFYSSTGYYDQSNTNSVSGSIQKVYYEYVGYRPLIYWVDPFGRTVELSNTHFAPTAECGKPVIYLYPEKQETVDVRLQPLGGFSKTEPAYDSGWRVVAQPNGQLTNLRDGKTYPYLFWEGRGGIYTQPTQGFTVAQADVHAFLIEKLHLLGLNEQETKDFIEFWEPRMQGSPYYHVAFLGKASMDRLAPLQVTPKPDTIIRVLMDFTPVDRPIALPEQHITTPKRLGFTVVEWGGVIR